MLGQDMVETTITKSEGVTTKKAHLEQSLFSIVCSADDTGLYLFPFSIAVKLESPASFPERLSATLMEFKTLERSDIDPSDEMNGRPYKRLKQTIGDVQSEELDDVMHEVEILSQLVSSTVDEETDEYSCKL
jgi:hypothetical protein